MLVKKLQKELVVLVDKRDRRIGVMEKDKVHGKDTPLHRAFSLFVFRPSPKASERQVMWELLVTQRAKTKKTWPGVWSNTLCGHPMPGERRTQAIIRRSKQELGFTIQDLRKVSNYQYKFERNGVVENEICPVYVAKTDQDPKPNRDEVEDWKWMEWEEFKWVIAADKKGVWSEWCKEEAELVEARLGAGKD